MNNKLGILCILRKKILHTSALNMNVHMDMKYMRSEVLFQNKSENIWMVLRILSWLLLFFLLIWYQSDICIMELEYHWNDILVSS